MKKFKFLTIAVFVLGFAAVSFSAGHTTSIESKYDYKTTVEKAINAVKANKKATLFAVIDHGENAKKLNAEMGRGTLIIFGNPAFGASFMKEYPQAGIDLPLRIYIFEDKGKVYFSYINPTDIAKNYKGADKHEFIKGTQNMLDGMAKNIIK